MKMYDVSWSHSNMTCLSEVRSKASFNMIRQIIYVKKHVATASKLAFPYFNTK